MIQKWIRRAGFPVLAVFLLAALYAAYQTKGVKNIGKADPFDKGQVARGLQVYVENCASCHGKELEGQPDWRIRKPDGKLPAPPHDQTGHTWHHPDGTLFEIIKYGLVPPHAPDGYLSDMPKWGGTLTDEDIWAVLAYIKSRWPEEIQKFQQDINTRPQQSR
jgi:mono/diheme cytochrome c family protein